MSWSNSVGGYYASALFEIDRNLIALENLLLVVVSTQLDHYLYLRATEMTLM